MKFWQRLRYYMVGVGIGLVVTFFFFRNRGCAWLPQNRVLNTLEASVILRTDSMACVMQRCCNISDEDVFHLLRNGDVEFRESDPQSRPKEYVVSAKRKSDNSSYKIRFALYDTTSVILSAEPFKDCDCVSFSDTALHILSMPEKMLKEMFLNKDISITTEGNCEMECYGLDQLQVVEMLKQGGVDHRASTPFSYPHPRYVIISGEYRMLVEMTKDKTRILEIRSEKKSCSCRENEE